MSASTTTTDEAYGTAEAYCDDYYALRVDEIEEAVVMDYVEASSEQVQEEGIENVLLSIEALCSPSTVDATDGAAVEAVYSIRFVAYASALGSRAPDRGTLPLP